MLIVGHNHYLTLSVYDFSHKLTVKTSFGKPFLVKYKENAVVNINDVDSRDTTLYKR